MSWILPGLVLYKQEPLWRGPFQLCPPEKGEQLSKMERTFCLKDKTFSHGSADIGTFCFVFYVQYTSEAPNPNSQSLVSQFWSNFQMICSWFTWLFQVFNFLQLIWMIKQKNIPHICHGRHGRRPCKNFLAGVNFYKFNAKNGQFTV